MACDFSRCSLLTLTKRIDNSSYAYERCGIRIYSGRFVTLVQEVGA